MKGEGKIYWLSERFLKDPVPQGYLIKMEWNSLIGKSYRLFQLYDVVITVTAASTFINSEFWPQGVLIGFR